MSVSSLRNVLAATTALACFAFPSIAAAQAVQPEYCTADQTVFAYTNGVSNSFEEASRSLEQLKPIVRAAATQAQYDKTRFELRYNRSGCGIRVPGVYTIPGVSCLLDVLEVFLQIGFIEGSVGAATYPLRISLYWELLGNATDAALRGRFPDLSDPQIAAAREALATAQARVASAARSIVNQNDDASYYSNEIDRGRRVIVVAHSQGNLFANGAYSAVATAKKPFMRVIGVGSPDSASPGGPYTTLTNDRVINALRLIPPASPLPGNATNQGSCGDLLCHAFTDEYLRSGTASRTAIVGNITTAYSNVAFPSSQFADGAITVTVTWNAEPDVDTHVYEPNGTHVFYSNLRGTAGTLDRDDTSGFGPENYVVPCATLANGSYRVALNYFAGSGPAPTQVRIRAGDVRRDFQKTLTNVRGSSGNNSPEPVATITVTPDTTVVGGRRFDVR